MRTKKQEMKAFLAGLQQLQRNDEFEHDIQVSVSTVEGESLMVKASFTSNIDGEDDDSMTVYHCCLQDWGTRRENEAEYEKFKYLLLSDVKK